MTVRERVGAALAERALQLVGVAFGGSGIAHFWTWSRGDGQALRAAVASGDVPAAVSAAVAYGEGHPAYVLAVLAGTVLFVRRP